MSHFTSINVSL